MKEKNNFNVDFPNLKISIRNPEPDPLMYSMWVMEKMLEDIQKYCVEKQHIKKKMLMLIDEYQRARKQPISGDAKRDFHQREIAILELKYELGL